MKHGASEMNRPLIIVGVGLLAEQMHYYFETLGGRSIDAFVLDPDYIREPHFLGRPVLAQAEALQRFAPDTHDAFVAIGFLATRARQRWFEFMQAAGYTLSSYVHPSAMVAANVAVGPNTLIQEQVVVAPFAHLGDDVMLCPQVGINHHTRVGAHSFFAPAAVVAGQASIGERCFIGTHATVRDRVRVGDDCVIGAGSVIMHDCPAGGVYRAPTTARTRENT